VNFNPVTGGGGAPDFGDVGGMTAGSIPFAGSTGFLAQDNANLFWDDSNNRLGVGIVAPEDSRVDITRTGVISAPADAAVGLFIKNTTTATGTALAQSPMLVFEGQAFDGAASFEVQFGFYVQPRSTGGAGGGNVNTMGVAAIDTQQQLRLYYNTADGGWTQSLIFCADGSIIPATAAAVASTQLPRITGYSLITAQFLRATSGAVTDVAAYQYFLVTAGALTGLTSYELVEFDLGAQTTTFAAGGGTTATAFGVSIKGPAIAAATDARTITDAASFYIDDSPDAGANITITNSWAIWVDDGAVRLDVEGVGATTADADLGLLIANNTDAAAGAQQHSSMLVLEGQGWKTDATAETREVQFGLQVIPVEGAANPTGRLSFFSNINDGGFTERMRIDTLTAATETALWIYDGDNAALNRVTVGVADSGGSGFKLLCIPN